MNLHSYLHFKERLSERYFINDFSIEEYKQLCQNNEYAILFIQDKSKMVLLNIRNILVCAIKADKGYLITALPIERAIKAVQKSNPRNRKFYRCKPLNNK